MRIHYTTAAMIQDGLLADALGDSILSLLGL